MKDFEGKGFIVTGASRGIGRAIALEAARRGANVAFNYRQERDNPRPNSKLRCEALGSRRSRAQVDVGDLKAVREMVDAAKSAIGRIDGLVNNAGLTRDKLLHDDERGRLVGGHPAPT